MREWETRMALNEAKRAQLAQLEAERREASAIMIQSQFRMRLGKKKFNEVRKEYDEKLRIEKQKLLEQEARERLAALNNMRLKEEQEEMERKMKEEEAKRIAAEEEEKKLRALLALQKETEETKALIIQSMCRQWLARRRVRKLKEERMALIRERYAIKIQCAWRCRLARHEFERIREEKYREMEEGAAIMIQALFRGRQARKRVKELKERKAIIMEGSPRKSPIKEKPDHSDLKEEARKRREQRIKAQKEAKKNLRMKQIQRKQLEETLAKEAAKDEENDEDEDDDDEEGEKETEDEDGVKKGGGDKPKPKGQSDTKVSNKDPKKAPKDKGKKGDNIDEDDDDEEEDGEDENNDFANDKEEVEEEEEGGGEPTTKKPKDDLQSFRERGLSLDELYGPRVYLGRWKIPVQVTRVLGSGTKILSWKPTKAVIEVRESVKPTYTLHFRCVMNTSFTAGKGKRAEKEHEDGEEFEEDTARISEQHLELDYQRVEKALLHHFSNEEQENLVVGTNGVKAEQTLVKWSKTGKIPHRKYFLTWIIRRLALYLEDTARLEEIDPRYRKWKLDYVDG